VLRLAPLLLATGCIIPFATPPIKGEIGGATRVGRATRLDGDEMRTASSSALHASVGAHVASATLSNKQRFDVGTGWTMERTKDAMSNGVYLDTSWFIDRGGHARTSIGARGEFRWLDDGAKGAAAKLRIDTELFKAGTSDFESDTKCGSTAGQHIGTTAIGVFVEAGRAWAPEMSGGDAWVATAGVTVRLPSAVGVWIGIPWCK
jgi:hypothetical protein